MGLGIRSIVEKQYGESVPSRYLPVVEAHEADACEAASFALAIYRIQRRIYVDYFAAGGDTADRFLRVLSSVQRQYCACELFYSADIGQNFVLVHTLGTVVGPRARIGNNCTMYHGVTIGTKYDTSKAFPSIGDDVVVYAGAKVLGGISVGDGAVVGANAVVLSDVPARAVMVGQPARQVGTAATGRYKLPVLEK